MAFYKAYSELHSLYSQVPIIWDQVKEDYPGYLGSDVEEWMLKSALAIILKDNEIIGDSMVDRYVVLRIYRIDEWNRKQDEYKDPENLNSNSPYFPRFDMFDKQLNKFIKIFTYSDELLGLQPEPGLDLVKRRIPETRELTSTIQMFGCYHLLINKENGTVIALMQNDITKEIEVYSSERVREELFPTGIQQIASVLLKRKMILKELSLDEFPQYKEESFIGMPDFMIEKFNLMNIGFEDEYRGAEKNILGQKESNADYMRIVEEKESYERRIQSLNERKIEAVEELKEFYKLVQKERSFIDGRITSIPSISQFVSMPFSKMDFSYFKGTPVPLKIKTVLNWISKEDSRPPDSTTMSTFWSGKVLPFPYVKFSKIDYKRKFDMQVREFFRDLTDIVEESYEGNGKESDLVPFIEALKELKERPFNIRNCNSEFPDDTDILCRALGLGRKPIPQKKGLIIKPSITEMDEQKNGKPRPIRIKGKWERRIVEDVMTRCPNQLFSRDLLEFDSNSSHPYDLISKAIFEESMGKVKDSGTMKNIVMFQRLYRDLAGMITEAQYSNVHKKAKGKKQKRDKSSWFLTFPIITNFHSIPEKGHEFAPSTSEGIGKKRKLVQEEAELDMDFEMDLCGVCIRGQNHSKFQSDKIPIFVIQELDPKFVSYLIEEKNGFMLKWSIAKMKTIEEGSRWFAFRRNSYKKVDPSFFAFPNINIIEPINTFGNERLYAAKGNLTQLAMEVSEGNQRSILKSLTEEFIQAVTMDNFDQGLFPFIRYLFLTKIAEKSGESTFVLDLGEFKEKMLREYKSSNFAKTYLDIALNYV